MKRQTAFLALIAVFLFCTASISHARYYDPESGRFISRDPIGGLESGSPNLYQYVLSNPTGYTDPSGLYTYFAVYYTDDPNDSFKRAADTWKDNLTKENDWNPVCDVCIMKGVKTEEDFVKAWNEIDSETKAREGKVPDDQWKIKSGIIFSHAGKEALYWRGSNLTSEEIKALGSLPWHDSSQLSLQGCTR